MKSPKSLAVRAFSVMRQTATALVVSLLSFATAYAQIPLSFVENRGQAPSDVLFTAGSVAVKRSEVVVNDALHIRFAGAALPRVRGVEPLPGRASVFLGRDPSRWRTNIATFGAVE